MTAPLRLAAAVALLCPGAALAETHVVHLVSDYQNMHFYFDPSILTIAPGDTVQWVDDANEEHNIITYPGGYPEGAKPIDSPYLEKKGDSFSYTFTQVGTYQYHCLPHLMMGMKGEIVVGRRSTPAEFHVPSREELMAYRKRLLEWFDESDNMMQVRLSDKPSRGGN